MFERARRILRPPDGKHVFRGPGYRLSDRGIPETLGPAGIGLARKNCEEIAELMALILEDPGLRETIVKGQKERLRDLSLEKNRERFKSHLSPFLGDH